MRTVLILVLVAWMGAIGGGEPGSAAAVILHFDAVPGGDWELRESGGASYVSDGILTIDALGAHHEFILYAPKGEWNRHVSNTRGWVLEARLRVDPASNLECGSDLLIWAHDHTSLLQVGFAPGEICIFYPDRVHYPMNTSDGFHAYRIVSRLASVRIYVDGRLAIDHTLSHMGGGTEALLFGDGNAQQATKSRSYWDYLWYDVVPDLVQLAPGCQTSSLKDYPAGDPLTNVSADVLGGNPRLWLLPPGTDVFQLFDPQSPERSSKTVRGPDDSEAFICVDTGAVWDRGRSAGALPGK